MHDARAVSNSSVEGGKGKRKFGLNDDDEQEGANVGGRKGDEPCRAVAWEEGGKGGRISTIRRQGKRKKRKVKTHLAETSPLTEELGVGDLDEVDLVLSAESLDELDVLALSAGLVENAEVSLTLVEGLGGLTETTGEAVVDEGVLENVLEGVL